MKTVCVVGLGYIGLPTAAVIASRGAVVIGLDIDQDVVDTVNSGEIHIEEPHLRDLVKLVVEAGRLSATVAPVPADVFLIAVPTPLTEKKGADLRAVKSAASVVASVLKKGDLVVLESTSPPGTTEGIVQLILEETGLVAGLDFHLAYSPERVLPGKIIRELQENDRVVGGIDEESTRVAAEFYRTFVDGDVMETTARTAEAVKLMENTYRDINIALANEFALVAEEIGVDVWEAVRLANFHPRVNILQPGPGVGGHCIAVDPHFLAEAAPAQARLIALSREINDSMPDYAASLVSELTPLAGRVACLGLAFKPDVDDLRESPAMEVVRKLIDRGFDVVTYDPYAVAEEFASAPSLAEAVANADTVVHLVHHRQFKKLEPIDFSAMKGRAIVDCHGTWDAAAFHEEGFTVRTLGVGTVASKLTLQEQAA